MHRKAMIRSLEIGHKSGKSQGILKWKMSGNPGMVTELIRSVNHFTGIFQRANQMRDIIYSSYCRC